MEFTAMFSLGDSLFSKNWEFKSSHTVGLVKKLQAWINIMLVLKQYYVQHFSSWASNLLDCNSATHRW
jgi:hypothetical protein